MISTDLLFRTAKGGAFKLPARIVTILKGFVQDKLDTPESGGVLLGRYIIGSLDVIVDKLTQPMQRDEQSRLRFYRDARKHQQAIDQFWSESEGTCHYLGEWHTHPELVPSPSSQDLCDWQRRLYEDKFDSHSLFFVIVGIDVINIWEGMRESLNIHLLKPVLGKER